MKILKKRVVAFFIDALIFGLFYELCRNILSGLFTNFGTIGYLIVFCPFFFKDIIFKNASIGKKIMGIAVYDNEWKRPKSTTLIKRAFLMTTVGYLLFFKIKFIDGNIVSLFDWEQNILKTRVADKKVLKELQKELQKQAKCESENNYKKITCLYNEYLRNIYINN